MLPLIIRNKKLEFNLICIKYIFPNDTTLPKNKINIINLSVRESDYIYDNYEYQEYTSIQYISERISNDISLGIREDNKLVEWVMIHDDGAIGILNVLPNCRKKGYAKELMIAIIKEL